MDVIDEELLKFWRILDKNSVMYIMSGGFALTISGCSWAPNDATLWLKDELSNRQNLIRAFVELGYGDHPSLETIQFDLGWTQINVAGGLFLIL